MWWMRSVSSTRPCSCSKHGVCGSRLARDSVTWVYLIHRVSASQARQLPHFDWPCRLNRSQGLFHRLRRVRGFRCYLLFLLLLHTISHLLGNRVLFFLRHGLHLRFGQTLLLEQLLANAFGRGFVHVVGEVGPRAAGGRAGGRHIGACCRRGGGRRGGRCRRGGLQLHTGLGKGFVDTVVGLVQVLLRGRHGHALLRRLQGTAVQRAGGGIGRVHVGSLELLDGRHRLGVVVNQHDRSPEDVFGVWGGANSMPRAMCLVLLGMTPPPRQPLARRRPRLAVSA